MRRARFWLMAVAVITGADAAVRIAVGQEARPADSPKGNWGRVTPIADGNHPNLYYNQSEIDELRKMMLVQHAPKHLYDRYKAEIRDAVAVTTIPDNKQPHHTNMKAALSYAIEPTARKADAMRASLLSFIKAFPTGLPGWYDTPGCYFSGYSVPWMFDLLMAYHPGTFSAAEKTKLKDWFRMSAENLKFDTRNPGAPSQSGHDVVPPERTREKEWSRSPTGTAATWGLPWPARSSRATSPQSTTGQTADGRTACSPSTESSFPAAATHQPRRTVTTS